MFVIFTPIVVDNSVLHILNSGQVKDLQKLQTVGAKRAHLIFDFRELNGTFQTVSIYTTPTRVAS